ncbi:endonuclease V [Flavobacterium luminosum]|uniref:Endonuclease V n=1 Tax=Flavobacterium luminosum TaxID=2949086 RepID=A0ABT0TLK0_9FLAO|nr:endonuclease V [Flavobacterium sp. HXWNR70]MCL9807748.1 endonuclease V [Flavobacterium sp. HXWNR70]
MGGYVWELLGKKIPVIGVAKNTFHSNKSTVEALYRGDSNKPLYVSVLGMERAVAVTHLQNMHGDFRIPSILKVLDTITKIND